MHPLFHQDLLHQRERRLRQTPQYTAREAAVAPRDEPVALRCERVHDLRALTRLAELECRRLPPGPFLVAEVGGAVVAALALPSRARLGDPFASTEELWPLLELRAAQLERSTRSSTRRGRAAWRALTHRA